MTLFVLERESLTLHEVEVRLGQRGPVEVFFPETSFPFATQRPWMHTPLSSGGVVHGPDLSWSADRERLLAAVRVNMTGLMRVGFEAAFGTEGRGS